MFFFIIIIIVLLFDILKLSFSTIVPLIFCKPVPSFYNGEFTIAFVIGNIPILYYGN